MAIATPAHYEAIENSIRNHGDLGHKRAPGTIKLQRNIQKAWTDYFGFRSHTEIDFLSNYSHERIIAFLIWLKDTRKITKGSSLITMWNYFKAYLSQKCPLPSTIRSVPYSNAPSPTLTMNISLSR